MVKSRSMRKELRNIVASFSFSERLNQSLIFSTVSLETSTCRKIHLGRFHARTDSTVLDIAVKKPTLKKIE
jgi:hypothetical protein